MEEERDSRHECRKEKKDLQCVERAEKSECEIHEDSKKSDGGNGICAI